MGFPGGSDGKEFVCNAGRPGFDSWVEVGKIPWRRKWQLTLVFSPGKSHGQKSLAGYSPRGCNELDTTEQLLFHFFKIYTNMESLCCTPETHVMLCVSYASIKKLLIYLKFNSVYKVHINFLCTRKYLVAVFISD